MSKVQTGINDLYTWCINNGEYGKRLLKEFKGVDADGHNISIHKVSKGSNKKIWWICEMGHTWLAQPNARTSCRSGCPLCADVNRGESITLSRLVVGKNDLLTWCNNNNEYGQTIKKEFIGLDVNKKEININEVLYGSKKEILWRCDNGHIFSMSPNSRTNIHTRYGCPICSGQRTVSGVNDLKTWCENNKEFGQLLLQEWTGVTEDNQKVDMSKINVGNKILRMRWMCKEGHEWIAPISSRTGRYRNCCPQCYNAHRSEVITAAKLIPGINDLYSWCMNNGNIGNVLYTEYTGMDDNGNNVSIHDINIHSHKKVIWKCKNNHIWDASVRNRVFRGYSCPKCNIWGTSYPEQFLYRAFKQIYNNTLNRESFKGYEFDIAVPELRLCIEYSNFYYHKNKLDRDKCKKDLCDKHNVRFIQIYAHNGELDINEEFTEDMIIYKVPIMFSEHKLQLNRIMNYILHNVGCNKYSIDFESAHNDAYNFMNNINKEN